MPVLREFSFVLSLFPTQVTDKPDVNVFAKTFVTDWAGCCKYQLTRVNDYAIGDGSTLQKVRWTFETTIKFILRCGTHLVKLDDSFEFKKDVSGYLKNVIIQSIIDSLKKIKVNTSFLAVYLHC